MTESATDGGGILKTDKRGRVRSTLDQRLAVLEQMERSGLSGPQFARVAGIPYQTLATWRQRHKKAGQSQPPAVRLTPAEAGAGPCRSIRLVEVAAAAEPATSARLRIDLPGGASTVVADRAQAALAAALIQALEVATSC